jgi:hypothetical protein
MMPLAGVPCEDRAARICSNDEIVESSPAPLMPAAPLAPVVPVEVVPAGYMLASIDCTC